ncbi:hypothetical protein M153_2776000201, partial [Pseudoloma neurophilia]
MTCPSKEMCDRSELKEKIFSRGIFGAYCTFLKDSEILTLLYEPWAEFVTEEQIRELESSFTTMALDSKQSEILKKFEIARKKLNGDCLSSELSQIDTLCSKPISISSPFIVLRDEQKNNQLNLLKNYTIKEMSLLKQITTNFIVRMNTVAWKEFLTNGSFNFTSKEYYFVFDMLIRVNNTILVSEMRTTLNVDPKKMFYIVKKINDLGYIDRIEQEGKTFVRIRRDEYGNVIKGQKKEKKRSINSEDNIQPEISEPVIHQRIGSEFVIGVPLIVQMKTLIDKSRNGISSKDIEEKFGIKLKIGLKLLNKIADKFSESIKTVEEFEGKIKRTKFYNIDELNKRKEKNRLKIEKGEENLNGEGITFEDRINVINQLLSTKTAFLLDREIYQEFQTILGVKYNFDRRTIVNAARKGGFNVYRLPQGNSGSKMVIARSDITENHPSIRKFIQTKKNDQNLTPFQKNVYKFFVLPIKSTEIDNLYQLDSTIRLNIFINFLNTISKVEFEFDCNILENMPIYTFFQLVSIKKSKFVLDLIDILRKPQIYKVENQVSKPTKQKENNNIKQLSADFTYDQKQ